LLVRPLFGLVSSLVDASPNKDATLVDEYDLP